MCGLPGHTYNECLVFFGKPGVTKLVLQGRHACRRNRCVLKFIRLCYVVHRLVRHWKLMWCNTLWTLAPNGDLWKPTPDVWHEVMHALIVGWCIWRHGAIDTCRGRRLSAVATAARWCSSNACQVVVGLTWQHGVCASAEDVAMEVVWCTCTRWGRSF
jgi:hypothetical protein